MIHKVVISDRELNIVEDLTGKIGNLKWSYNRIGGCASFSFDISERFCREVPIGMNYNVKIYGWNQSTRTMDLKYQGRLENKRTKIRGISESIQVQGNGYQSELSDIYIDQDFSNKTIEFIVDAILDLVTPNTNITKGTISATGFTADTLEFNTDALKAIQTCADIVGFEWGVDKNRNFTFQAKSTTTSFVYSVGDKLKELDIDYDSKDLNNRLIITGGDVSGSPYTKTENDTNSQIKWKRRDKTYQNSSIVTDEVATQVANSIFSKKTKVLRRSKATILDEIEIESTIPLGMLEILTDTDTFGTRKFGTGLFNKILPFDVDRIQYNLDNHGNLILKVQLERPAPTEYEKLAEIEFKLDQVRQQGV